MGRVIRAHHGLQVLQRPGRGLAALHSLVPVHGVLPGRASHIGGDDDRRARRRERVPHGLRGRGG
jgi:hypothetical protein